MASDHPQITFKSQLSLLTTPHFFFFYLLAFPWFCLFDRYTQVNIYQFGLYQYHMDKQLGCHGEPVYQKKKRFLETTVLVGFSKYKHRCRQKFQWLLYTD